MSQSRSLQIDECSANVTYTLVAAKPFVRVDHISTGLAAVVDDGVDGGPGFELALPVRDRAQRRHHEERTLAQKKKAINFHLGFVSQSNRTTKHITCETMICMHAAAFFRIHK